MAPTMQVPNKIPSTAPVTVRLTGPKLLSPNRLPIWSRRRRELAEQQVEGVEAEQLAERSHNQPARGAGDDAPRRTAPAGEARRSDAEAHARAADHRREVVRHVITSSTDAAPMPAASGCDAPAKP